MSILPTRIAGSLAHAATVGLAFLTALAPTAAGAPIAFEGHVDYATGRFPLRVIAADLNGDGYADIVTANPDSFNPPFAVSVLLNLGNGTFAEATSYVTSAPGRCVAAGDLDGDGDQDLAVGLQTGPFRIAVLVNDGLGHFAAPELLAPIFGRPDGIAIADLDRDGDRDLLIAQGAGADEVVVLLNQGNGTFGPASPQAGPSDAYFVHLAVGDIDADGDPDLAISRSLSGIQPSLYRNRGDGTFEPRAPLDAVTFEYAGVDFGDLDGDLDLDLVLVSELGPRLLVLRNNGAGVFAPVGIFPSGIETQLGNQVRLADLDRDGRADVIVPAAVTYRLATLRSLGAGGLEAGTPHDLVGQPTSVAAADLDNDGDLDLVGGSPHTNQVSVLRNISGTTTAAGAPGAETALSFGPALANPTPLGATIPCVLGTPAEVRISVTDVTGRRVRELFQGEMAAGEHRVTWDGRNDRGVQVGSGLYLVELDGGTWRRMARVLVAR